MFCNNITILPEAVIKYLYSLLIMLLNIFPSLRKRIIVLKINVQLHVANSFFLKNNCTFSLFQLILLIICKSIKVNNNK